MSVYYKRLAGFMVRTGIVIILSVLGYGFLFLLLYWLLSWSFGHLVDSSSLLELLAWLVVAGFSFLFCLGGVWALFGSLVERAIILINLCREEWGVSRKRRGGYLHSG